tara:strand:+ start:995 stop:1195 length:201 start_codon:yes stop_codon:yes gene_type:complete
VKVGDLVEVGVKGQEDLILGVLIEKAKPEESTGTMHFINVLCCGVVKWWPAGYVRKVSEDVKMDQR